MEEQLESYQLLLLALQSQLDSEIDIADIVQELTEQHRRRRRRLKRILRDHQVEGVQHE